jgi:hypothetical protein
LGTRNIANQLKIFRPYKEAKKYAQSLKLKSYKEWREHTKTKKFPINIPAHPRRPYSKEFEGVGEFLGTGRIANQLRVFRSYKEAKKYTQSLKLKSYKEWRQHTKSKNFPKDIPCGVSRAYKNEWESWGVFLGTGNIANKLKNK